MRTLHVNADDFGFTRDVNEGIVHAHRHGILTATTLMANGDAFEHAVQLARATPGLDVGCHLVLTGGSSVVTGAPLPASVNDVMIAVMRGRLDPYRELRAQIERVVAAGIRPTHLDTHKHTHLFPPVLSAVARLGEEFRIRWVRRPFDLPISGEPVPWARRAVSRSLHFLRRRFHRVLERHGCRTTDHFAGFSLTGYLQASDLVRLFDQLPAGSTELMVHPGFCTDELRAAKTRLKESRQKELEALVAPEVRASLERNGIRLARY